MWFILTHEGQNTLWTEFAGFCCSEACHQSSVVILVSAVHRATCLRFLSSSDVISWHACSRGSIWPDRLPTDFVLLILKLSTAEPYRQGHEGDRWHWYRAVRMESPAAPRYSAEIKHKIAILMQNIPSEANSTHLIKKFASFLWNL
jgi:hypothetical protein